MTDVIRLGGVIIEIDGEKAWIHHGGYPNPDDPGHTIFDPIPVSWSFNGGKMTFQLRGWWCRVFEVIEGHRCVQMLEHPYWTVDGDFTVDWTLSTEGSEPTTLSVFRA